MIWINGKLKNNLSIYDRSIQFGDGCFTTAIIKKSKVQLLSYHLNRLKNDCKRLFITNIDWYLIKNEILSIASNYNEAILKIIISRGKSIRGYSTVKCSKATRIIILSQLSSLDKYKKLKIYGAKLTVSPIKLSKNTNLAGIKHLNRLEQILISIYLSQTNADEALVLDTDNFVIECCSANLFWSKKNKIYTPKLNQSGIDGIMRKFLIKKLSLLGKSCYEVKVKLQTIIDADELLICNSLMPILPVRQLNNNIFWSNRYLFDLLSPNIY